MEFTDGQDFKKVGSYMKSEGLYDGSGNLKGMGKDSK